MTKNLIPIIAKELGVEIGEEFAIEGDVGRYRFTKTNLEWLDVDHYAEDWIAAEDCVAASLVYGFSEIIKLPFEPKVGEIFWTYWQSWQVTNFVWVDGFTNHCLRKSCGLIFRTEAEALAARPAKYKELTGKEWEE